VAPKAVGDYASLKLKEAATKLTQANDLTNGLNDAQRLSLINEANDLNNAWGETGYARVALHTAIGGLTGNFEGAIGAASTALTIPMIAEQIKALDIPDEVKQALIMGAGAVVGGATGGTAGAGAGLSQVANNYLTHQETRTLLDKLKACNNSNACMSNLLADAKALSNSRGYSDLITDNALASDVGWANSLLASTNSDPAAGMLIRSGMSVLLGINESQLATAMDVPVLQTPSDQVSKNFTESFDRAWVGGTLAGAATMAPLTSLGGALATSTAINAGLDVKQQFNQYGEIKYPAELVINAGFGMVEGYLGGFSGAGFKGIAGEAAIGANSNMATMLIIDQYYHDKDHQIVGYDLLTTGSIGAGFGGGVKALEERKIVVKTFVNSKESIIRFLRNIGGK